MARFWLWSCPRGVLRQDEVFGEVMVLDGLIELQTAGRA